MAGFVLCRFKETLHDSSRTCAKSVEHELGKLRDTATVLLWLLSGIRCTDSEDRLFLIAPDDDSVRTRSVVVVVVAVVSEQTPLALRSHVPGIRARDICCEGAKLELDGSTRSGKAAGSDSRNNKVKKRH